MKENLTVDSMLYSSINHTFNNETIDMPYRYYFPSDYDEKGDKEYPFLLYLHGYGECGTENEKQIRVLNGPNALLDKVVANDNCIILCPQCPHDPASFNWVPINKEWKTCSRELTINPTVSLHAVMELVNTFIDKYKIDKKRVYVSGVSMGGYGTWEIITRMYDTFACAVPLCGAGMPNLASRLINMPIWAFHGEMDGTVLVSGTRDMEKAIKEAGGTKMKATYFEKVGHNVWPNAYNTEGLVEWMFSQSK